MSRQRAYRFGHWAEFACMLLLCFKAYRPLTRRTLTPFGEIDIIAERLGTLCFIEVKARQKREDGIASITADKRQRLQRAASAWLATNQRYANHTQRFDLMLVAPYRLPLHIKNAWHE